MEGVRGGLWGGGEFPSWRPTPAVNLLPLLSWRSPCLSVDCPRLAHSPSPLPHSSPPPCPPSPPPPPPRFSFYLIPTPFVFGGEGTIPEPSIVLPFPCPYLRQTLSTPRPSHLWLLIIKVKLLEHRKYFLYKTPNPKVPVFLPIKTIGTSRQWFLLWLFQCLFGDTINFCVYFSVSRVFFFCSWFCILPTCGQGVAPEATKALQGSMWGGKYVVLKKGAFLS